MASKRENLLALLEIEIQVTVPRQMCRFGGCRVFGFTESRPGMVTFTRTNGHSCRIQDGMPPLQQPKDHVLDQMLQDIPSFYTILKKFSSVSFLLRIYLENSIALGHKPYT
jgi:hypothetical protein